MNTVGFIILAVVAAGAATFIVVTAVRTVRRLKSKNRK